MFNPVSSTVTQSDTNPMDELLGLCSGQFTSLTSPRHAGNADSQTVPSSIAQSNFASNDIFKDRASSNDFTFDDRYTFKLYTQLCYYCFRLLERIV